MSMLGEFRKNLSFKAGNTADGDSIVGNDSENSSKSVLFSISKFFRTDKTYDPKAIPLLTDILLLKDTEDSNSVKEIVAGNLKFIRSEGYSELTSPAGTELLPVKDTKAADTYKEISLDTLAEFMDIYRSVLVTASNTPESLIGFDLPDAGVVRIEGSVTVSAAGNVAAGYKIVILATAAGIVYESIVQEYAHPDLYLTSVDAQLAAGVFSIVATGLYNTDITWAGRFSGTSIAE